MAHAHRWRSELAGVVIILTTLGVACTKSSGADVTVPYPDSVEPVEVLANVRAEIQRNRIAEDMRMPELAMRNGELQVRRILQIKSEKLPRAYLVVELERLSGDLVAIVGLTRGGVFMGAEDCRPCPTQGYRPLDLADAAARVSGRQVGTPRSVEYVYFDNFAEGGFSRFRPLVAVTTERGVVYLNAKAEAFTEEGSPLIEEFHKDQGTWALGDRPGLRHLRPLGPW